MEVRVTKIIGKQGDGVWGNVYEYYPEAEGLRIGKGRLIVVGELLIPELEEAAAYGKEFLTRINEIYYGSEGVIKDSLAHAARSVVEEFGDVDVDMAVVCDSRVYLYGNKAWIKVGDKEGWGLDSTRNFIVGQILGDMEVILGTKKFWDSLPLGMIRSDDAEALIAELHKSQGGAGAIIKFTTSNTSTLVEDKGEVIESKDEPKSNLHSKISALGKITDLIARRQIYVDEVKPIGYKKIVLTGVVFLTLFLVIFLAGRIKNREVALKNDQGLLQIEKIVEQYKEAKSLVVMNRERSQQLLALVQQQIESLTPKQLENEKIQDIKLGLGEVLGAAAGVVKINMQELVDLALVRDGAQATQLVFGEQGQILVLDKLGGRVFGVNAKTGSAKVIAGKESLGETQLMAGYPGKYLVLSNKGAVECVVVTAVCEVKIQRESGMEKVVDLKMWAGNIYILKDSGIEKYAVINSGYGVGKNWMTKEEQMSGARAMAIDGSVWVAKDGQVLKYTAGEKDAFEIKGLMDELGSNLDIYTDENTDNIYILEKDKKKVSVVRKNGEYVEQWSNDFLGTVRDFIVDGANKRVYFVRESGVYFYESR